MRCTATRGGLGKNLPEGAPWFALARAVQIGAEFWICALELGLLEQTLTSGSEGKDTGCSFTRGSRCWTLLEDLAARVGLLEETLTSGLVRRCRMPVRSRVQVLDSARGFSRSSLVRSRNCGPVFGVDLFDSV